MENETPQDLRTRTADFALLIIKLYVSLPKTTETQPTLKADLLRKETNELLAIFTTIVTKTKKRMGRM